MPGQAQSVSVRWGRVKDESIMLRYRVDGCAGLTLPKPTTPGPADGLWKTTCFELFLAQSSGHYHEFNFSPSGQWAAYGFSGYRNGREPIAPLALPVITIDHGPHVFTLTVFLHAAELIGARNASLTAVLEEARGRKSYWASRHCGLQPDFHNPACFVLPIP